MTPRHAVYESGTVRYWHPCADHPSGELQFVLTTQIASARGTSVPMKRCAKCHRSLPCLAFLSHGSVNSHAGYLEVLDKMTCYDCARPTAVPLWRDGRGRVRMRLLMRDETGAPIRFHDDSTKRWRAASSFGLRLMTGTNVLRLQPYTKRDGTTRSTKTAHPLKAPVAKTPRVRRLRQPRLL